MIFQHTCSVGKVLLLILTAGVAFVPAATAQTFDWDSWRCLRVLDEGRQKPLDTLARETLRAVANRTEAMDPETGERLDACTLYLGMVFDWHGWGREGQSVGRSGQGSPHIPYPDKWDAMPLLHIEFRPLRSALGLKPEQQHISPLELSHSKIRVPDDGQEMPLLIWTATLTARRRAELSPLERAALDLSSKFRSYQDWRAGRQLKIVPQPASSGSLAAEPDWLSLSEIMGGHWDDTSDGAGHLRLLQQQFQQARRAYRKGSVAGFNQASAQLRQTIVQVVPSWGVGMAAARINWEVALNRWQPFRCASLLMLCASGLLLLSMHANTRIGYWAAHIALAGGLLAILIGLGVRSFIMVRAPVCNMYESVIFTAWGVAFFGFGCELLSRQRFVVTVAAIIASVMLVVAEGVPGVLDPSLQPLEPVLRSNLWLAAHGLTITLGLAALALAWGMGNVTLGCFPTASRHEPLLHMLTRITHRCLSLGVFLLAIGIVSGCIWADRAWGRFWGWDPKEAWALITLLAYLAVLQAGRAGRLGPVGLAWCSVNCFALVVMTWYGVNFVLGAGLHRYGFGSGGQSYVLVVVVVQLLYAVVVGVRHYRWLAFERRRRQLVPAISGRSTSPLVPATR